MYLLVVVADPLQGRLLELFFVLSGLEEVHVCEHHHHNHSLHRHGLHMQVSVSSALPTTHTPCIAYLHVGQLLHQVVDTIHGVTHHQVQRVAAVKAGIHEPQLRVTAKVPKVKGEPSAAEREYFASSVFPLHHL